MKNFLIVARSFSDIHQKYIEIIENYLKSKGCNCQLDINPVSDESTDSVVVDDGIDCVISVGGDGTIVRLAQNISRPQVPIVGMNCGHLGYLCDMNADNVINCLEQLISGNYKISKRMMLEGAFTGDANRYCSLNDIVVTSKLSGLYVLNLTVKVNGIQLYNHNCDGLIVATPTGSTAYNLSSNGPIVSPHSNCIILTPINPHTLNSRSIILSSEDEVEVSIMPRHESDKPEANVIYDGVPRQVLGCNETLTIYKAKATTNMCMLENVSFLERIRARMQEI